VFIANGAMMFFPHFKKIWLNSISGIFMGVFLTFSGLGVSLYPSTVTNSFLQLRIILIYSSIGLIAGLLCTYFGKEKKANQTKYNKNTGSVALIRSDACNIYLNLTFSTYKMQQFLKVRYSY
jgi:hypothetical protein